MSLKFYEINPSYIDYISPFAPHLFQNKKPNQKNERKYIGIVLAINEINYFVPLSSFKEKHKTMQNTIDFIKIKHIAVLNLNNMFPAALSDCKFIDFRKITDEHYKNLVLEEYRFIKKIEEKICKSAKVVYFHKIEHGEKTKLAKRCNNFLLLENKCREWQNS